MHSKEYTMILLSFAHRGEAQSFINYYGLKSDNNKLFTSDRLSLIITGEGIYESLISISHLIGQLKPEIIINYGIAGSLNKEAQLDQIYQIRTHYYYSDNIEFKTYTDSTGSLDLISSDSRIFDDQLAIKLSHFAHIVDREAWAIAKSASSYNTAFKTFKLISDNAGSEVNCFDIKNKAQFYSDQMLEHFQNQVELKPIEKREKLAQLNLSFTQMALLKRLLKLKVRKENLCENDLIQEVNSKLHEKKREECQLYLETLQNSILPFQAKAQQSFTEFTKELEQIGVNCSTDPNFEKQFLNINFKINSQKNIDNLIECLKKTNYSKLESIWEGKLDV